MEKASGAYSDDLCFYYWHLEQFSDMQISFEKVARPYTGINSRL
jgi:hypothetical protein